MRDTGFCGSVIDLTIWEGSRLEANCIFRFGVIQRAMEIMLWFRISKRFGEEWGTMKSILALVLGIFSASQSAQPGQSATPISDTRTLLKIWEAIPDLFTIARVQAQDKGDDVHALQKALEQEYRAGKKTFKLTTNYRHQDQCSTKEHHLGAADFLAVDSKGENVKFTRMGLHEIEAHGAAFPPAIAAFLRKLPDPSSDTADLADPSGLKLVEFPGSLKLEHNVKDAYGETAKKDPRWTVSKDLRFTPPARAVLKDGPGGRYFQVQALLSNPTARAIKVYGWQVNASNPLSLAPIEDANLKRKPPDPNQPPLPPPVPLPPMGITIPPKTTVRFSDGVHLYEYDFKGGAPAKLKWSFHYWQSTVAEGTLEVTLPGR